MSTPTGLPDLGDVVERLDHVAFGVADVAEGARFVRLLGGTFFDGADSPPGAFRWAQFRMPGGGKVELIAPLTEESFVASFLERRGEGIHHVTLKVRDLDEAVARATAAGQRVVGHARLHANWAEAFLHPSTALGAVVQLAEWDDSAPAGTSDWDALLAGEVVEGQ
jgi:methylmalonyl-CoA/ethylmalonyl-CoA epimerase